MEQVAAIMALTVILERKGRALDAISESMTTLRDHLTAENRLLLDRLVAARSRLAALISGNPADNYRMRKRLKLRDLKTKQGVWRQTLAPRAPSFRIHIQRPSLSRVSEAIPDAAALVKSLCTSLTDAKLHSFGPLTMSHMCSPMTAQLNPRNWATRQSFTLPYRAGAMRERQYCNDHKQIARQLDERVMRPIRGFLEPFTTS